MQYFILHLQCATNPDLSVFASGYKKSKFGKNFVAMPGSNIKKR